MELHAGWDRVPSGERAPREVRVGDLVIDFEARKVSQGLRAAHLTPAEFDLLAVLVRKAGAVVTREALLNELHVDPGDIRARSVDVQVGRLRRALFRFKGRSLIRTVRGVGYMFERDDG